MSKPELLPSGNWRIKVQRNGERKSFTAKTKREAEEKASHWMMMQPNIEKEEICVKYAANKYISNRENVMSPKTIKEYKAQIKLLPDNIAFMNCYTPDADVLQAWVNEMALKLSEKTVANKYGFVRTVIRSENPAAVLPIKLPQEKRTEVYIPPKEDIDKLLGLIENDIDLTIAVLLASRCGLRRSEICALPNRPKDFKKGFVVISQSLVEGLDNKDVIKTTKTYESQRKVPLPKSVVKILLALPKNQERVINCRPCTITNRLVRIMQKHFAEEERFSLHDLRHYYCSVLIANGLPMYMVQRRMGHSTQEMTQRVYAHIVNEKQTEFDARLDEMF